MKCPTHEYKPKKEDHLENKPSNHYGLANVDGVRVGQEPGAVPLDVEAKQVAENENAR